MFSCMVICLLMTNNGENSMQLFNRVTIPGLIIPIAFLVLLTSCTDYKKVGFDGTITYEIKRQTTISPEGRQTRYNLTGFSIGDKVVKLKNDNNFIPPNKKHKVETQSMGDIKIKIYTESVGTFDIALWMTEEQISKFK